VLKWVIKIIFISSSPFAFLIINATILSSFQKEWCTFGRKKWHLKKNKDCPFSKFECFEHAKPCVKLWTCNFEIDEKYSKNIYDNLNYYASLVTFQTYKNVILRSVHSFGWLL
jgi:hypothetical protein